MKKLISPILICLLGASVVVSCRGTQLPATTSVAQSVVNDEISYEPQLLFLVFKIYKDSNRISPVALVSRNQVKGKMKGHDEHHIHEPSLSIYQIAANGLAIDSVFMEHPLYTHIEHYDEKEIHRHYVELDSAEFLVRLQLLQSTKTIKVVENRNQNHKLLNSIKL